MRVVPDIIGLLCHECVENEEIDHKIKMSLYGQSVPLLFRESNTPHFLRLDGRNKTTWHVGRALEKLPVHSPSKRLVILYELSLCAVYGMNNELYLSRLAMFSGFVSKRCLHEVNNTKLNDQTC